MKLLPLVLAIPLVSGQILLGIPIPEDPFKIANGAWESFKNSAGKKYADELLENSRKLIFQDNLSFIVSFNDLNATSSGFTLELNPFADLVSHSRSRCQKFYCSSPTVRNHLVRDADR